MRLTSYQAVIALSAVLYAGPVAAQQSINLPREDRLLASKPAAVFSVGKAEGQDWEMFSGVFSIDFDADDNLYVLDSQNHRVVVFDRAGRFVRQFGRRGDGPGELKFPMGMVVTADGAVVLADMGKHAYLRFTRDGQADGSTPYSTGQQLSPSTQMRAHPVAGIVLARHEVGDVSRLEQRVEKGERISLNYPTHIVTEPLRAGATGRRLFIQPAAEETHPVNTGLRNMPMRMAVPAPVHFAAGLHWAVTATGGIAINNTAEYRINVISAEGAVTRVLHRAIEPRKVTKTDRERVMEAQEKTQEMIRERMGSVQVSPEVQAMMDDMRKQMFANARFAEVHAVIMGLATDRSGRIWVSRGGSDGKGTFVDLVTAEGRYVGTLRDMQLPQAFSRSGRVAYIEFDDDGVQRVVVKQIPADWR